MRAFTITIRIVLAVVCNTVLPATPGFVETIRVPLDEPTIQDGIYAATSGDTVLVASGTYRGEGNRDISFQGKPIVVMSEAGPKETLICCEGSEADPHRGFHFYSEEDYRSFLMGFTIREGHVYMGKYGSDGGGICFDHSNSVVVNCHILENTATSFIYGNGGGISCYYSSPIILNCVVAGNTADGYGGGINCSWDSSPVLSNCIIADNNAGYAGGIECWHGSSPRIMNCVITGNSVPNNGGGVRCVHTCNPIIKNSILWNNSPQELYVLGSEPEVSFSDVLDGWAGEGNIDVDPKFVTRQGFDFLLHPQSPCIDAGDPSVEDFIYDWHPRLPSFYVDGARSDMGAYGGPLNRIWFD